MTVTNAIAVSTHTLFFNIHYSGDNHYISIAVFNKHYISSKHYIAHAAAFLAGRSTKKVDGGHAKAEWDEGSHRLIIHIVSSLG